MPPDASQPTDGVPERDAVLAMLQESMQEVRERIQASDPQTPEEERLLIKWFRAQGHLAGQYRLLKRDTDVDEMEDRLELLERASTVEGGR